MIDILIAKPGFSVYYQKPHMTYPDYGTIITVVGWDIVRVLFLGTSTAKPCNPEDLFWPPLFCAIHGNGIEGQPYSNDHILRPEFEAYGSLRERQSGS